MCGGMYASDTEVSEKYRIEFKYLLERLSVVNTAGRSFFCVRKKIRQNQTRNYIKLHS